MVNKAAIHAAAVAVYLSTVTLSGVAQTSFAALGGKVTDEQGGVLPGVTVTVRQLDTNTTRTGVTESNGQYYLPSLPAGRYELTMELAGFAPAKRDVCSASARKRRSTSASRSARWRKASSSAA